MCFAIGRRFREPTLHWYTGGKLGRCPSAVALAVPGIFAHQLKAGHTIILDLLREELKLEKKPRKV